MPTRYFEVDPWVSGLASGLAGLTQQQQQYEAELRARTAARKAYQRRLLTMGIGAGAGAIGGIALAPALGLGGSVAAGATIPGNAALGIGATSAGATTLTGTGALIGGLSGATAGATAAGQFLDGNVGAGLGALAAPVIGRLGQLEDREFRRQDRAESRAGLLADAITLDDARTANDLYKAEEASTIPQFGMTRSNATQAARQAYETAISGGPQAGQMLDLPSPYESQAAYGPMTDHPPMLDGPPPEPNIPGKSNIPGMERTWGPHQINQLGRLEQERQNTVDNPEWVARNGPEAREQQWHALARRRQDIGTMLVPSQPRAMIPGPDGQMIEAQPGFNPMPNVPGMWIDNEGNPKPWMPFKVSEQPFADPDVPAEKVEAHKRKMVSNYDEIIKNGGTVLVQPDGKVSVEVGKGGKGGDSVFNIDDFLKVEKSGIKTTGDVTTVPPVEATIAKLERTQRALKEAEAKASLSDTDRLLVNSAQALQGAFAVIGPEGLAVGAIPEAATQAAMDFKAALKAKYPNPRDIPDDLFNLLQQSVDAGLVR